MKLNMIKTNGLTSKLYKQLKNLIHGAQNTIHLLRKSSIQSSDVNSHKLAQRWCMNTETVTSHQTIHYTKSNAQLLKFHVGIRTYVSCVHNALLAVHMTVSDHSQSSQKQNFQNSLKLNKIVITWDTQSKFHKPIAVVVVFVLLHVQRVP